MCIRLVVGVWTGIVHPCENTSGSASRPQPDRGQVTAILDEV
ncbi:MAG: hypothetical protein AAFX06_07685 [Planctomycetota bacterium]